jgi:transposase-like protein
MAQKILGFKRRRNTIEPWFSKLKRRKKQFNTCYTTNNLKRIEKWIKAWTTLS